MSKAYRIIIYSSSMKYLIIILAFFNVCHGKPGGHSGERVHIRLHMPEVVRQHTHFHKVYKYAKKLPPPLPSALPPIHHNIVGKPHVSLLGYTTASSSLPAAAGSPGNGGMGSTAVGGIAGMLSPSIMHLMAATPTIPPTLMPNYGPALFDNFNQDFKESFSSKTATATTSSTTMRTPTSLSAVYSSPFSSPSSSSSSTSSSSSSSLSFPPSSSAKQHLLEQIFTPNLMAAINAAAAVQDSETGEIESVEKNSLLNQNFLDALQREYLSKFGGRRKRKKSHSKNYHHHHLQSRPTQYFKIQNQDIADDDMSENFDDYPEDYEEIKSQSQKMYSNNDWNYYGRETESDDIEDDSHGSYDSAVAFSGQDNMLSSLPTVDEFLDESSTGGKSLYGDLYDSYASTELSGPTSTTSPSSSNTMWSHSPTSWGSSSSSSGSRPYRTSSPSNRLRHRPAKVRYVKIPLTTTRRKRKNRFKRYRM